MRPITFFYAKTAVAALLLVFVIPIAALEPNDLWPGMSKADAVSVYTSLRSCENREFREDSQSLEWDASLYSRLASIKVWLKNNAAESIVIVLYLEPGDDGTDLFRALVEERNRDFGPPLESSLTSASQLSDSLPPKNSDVELPVSLVWPKDDHRISLERWPKVPAGEIHISRYFTK